MNKAKLFLIFLFLNLSFLTADELFALPKVGEKVIISGRFARNKSLVPGLWTVRGVTNDGRVIIETKYSEQIIVPKGKYVELSKTSDIGRVILSKKFAAKEFLAQGTWRVRAVGNDNSVVLRTAGGQQVIVPNRSYEKTVETKNSSVILSTRFTAREFLANGVWGVRATGESGSVVVITEGGNEVVVPKNSYTETVPNQSEKVVLSDRIAAREFLASGIWTVRATGADGSIVVRTEGDRSVVIPKGQYTPVNSCPGVEAITGALN